MSGEQERLEPLLQEVYAAVADRPGRTSSCRAIRLAAEQCGLGRRVARQAVQELVTAGVLRFVDDCGVSFLEKNFLGRFRLSPRVMISTVAGAVPPSPDAVMVRLLPGAAFGDCRHPTTRLCVRLLDQALQEYGRPEVMRTGLDIGTGSGILALAAAHLGVPQVVALDIDPCARREARENAAANGLAARIEVRNLPLPVRPAGFSLILANLRPPTLKSLAAAIAENTAAGGLAILSGMRTAEAAGVLDVFQGPFLCRARAAEDDWCALVLQRTV